MLSGSRESGTILLAVILLLVIPALAWAQGDVVELEFGRPPVSGSDTSRTLESLVKVQGTGGPCQTGLYLLTHVGDREDIFRRENQGLIDNPLMNQTWRFCSVFTAAARDSVVMGRNWDNENVGSIIVNLCYPPEAYSSVCFCRTMDLGFPLHVDLEEIKSSELGSKLLLAPFYVTDGINEHGLAVAVAGVRPTTQEPRDDKELVFVTFLMRKILDQTKTIEEAADLVEDFIPFHLDKNTLAAHFMVADSSGRSVILEYDHDQWRRTYGDGSWQVLTTKPIYNVPDADLRERCWRYRSISGTLEGAPGNVDWQAAMDILKDVGQKGTTWSVVYSPSAKDLYFSVYQDWSTVYHLEMP
jgi:hypothetical protein